MPRSVPSCPPFFMGRGERPRQKEREGQLDIEREGPRQKEREGQPQKSVRGEAICAGQNVSKTRAAKDTPVMNL